METHTRKYFLAILFLSTTCLCSLAVSGQQSPQKPAYDMSKDVGLQPPPHADILFDGTQQSIVDNWEMWPQRTMAITWSLVDNPIGGDKVLMTNGGKKWGTHDLVTKKEIYRF